MDPSDETIHLNVGDEYVEKGVFAVDREDGELMSNVEMTGGPVDTSIDSTYLLTYYFTDSDGNESTITRTVIVGNGGTGIDYNYGITKQTGFYSKNIFNNESENVHTYNSGPTITKEELINLMETYAQNPTEANKKAIEDANVSAITDMSLLFDRYNGNYSSELRTQLKTLNLDLSGWDTSNVTDMSYMFEGNPITTLPDTFNTSKVTNMRLMFSNSGITTLPDTFNTSKVTNMSYMFDHSWIRTLPDTFDTSNVTDMRNMFAYSKIRTLPASFNTSNVTDMSYMFYDTMNFTQDISNWNVDNVTNWDYINYNSNLSNYYIPIKFGGIPYTYNSGPAITRAQLIQLLENWGQDNSAENKEAIENANVSAITDMSYLFSNQNPNYSDNLNANLSALNLDLSGWDTSNVTNMSHMFENSGITTLPDTFNTSNVTDMSHMFEYSSISSLPTTFNLSKVTDLTDIFYMSILDSTNFNISYVVKTREDLTKLLENWGRDNSEINKKMIENADVSVITDMSYLFSNQNPNYSDNLNANLSALNLDLSKWNTSNVTDMSHMFENSGISTLPDTFNTSNVTDMSYMFSYSGIDTLPVGFDISKVTNMQYMFYNTQNFNQDITNWNVDNVTNWTSFSDGSILEYTNIPVKFR